MRQPGDAACSLTNFAKTVISLKQFPAAAAGTAAAAAAAAGGRPGLLVATASLDNVIRIFSLDVINPKP